MEKRFAWAVPRLYLGEPDKNRQEIGRWIHMAKDDQADYVVLPPLALTGYTCGDLFAYGFFLQRQEQSLSRLIQDMPEGITCVTTEMTKEGEKIMAFSSAGRTAPDDVRLCLSPDECTTDQINLLPLAHIWTIGSRDTLLCRLRGTRTVFCSCGRGESTSRAVYSGIGGMVRGDVHVGNQNSYGCLTFDELEGRAIPDANPFPDPKRPFVPQEERYLEEGLTILEYALRRRLDHLQSDRVVIGVSGGLDSTLALLIAYGAIPCKQDIHGLTMPCFGTSSRTKGNAEKLMDAMGITAKCIPIDGAVQVHFADIGQDMDDYSLTYENAQARERMQVLFDYANLIGGINLGTGDMSEAALGFTTYGGDHLSMYGIASGVPKTLVRALVAHCADLYPVFAPILGDILDTPISPELVPGGEQATEAIVGQYLYNDFILYHTVKNRLGKAEMEALLRETFGGEKADLNQFYRRMTAAQFKRNCMADSPQVVDFQLGPHGALQLPSDIPNIF